MNIVLTELYPLNRGKRSGSKTASKVVGCQAERTDRSFMGGSRNANGLDSRHGS